MFDYVCLVLVCVGVSNTNTLAEMVRSVFRNICVYMCSSSRQRVKKSTIPTYIYISMCVCECVCTRVTKHTAAAYVSTCWLYTCLCLQ